MTGCAASVGWGWRDNGKREKRTLHLSVRLAWWDLITLSMRACLPSVDFNHVLVTPAVIPLFWSCTLFSPSSSLWRPLQHPPSNPPPKTRTSLSVLCWMSAGGSLGDPGGVGTVSHWVGSFQIYYHDCCCRVVKGHPFWGSLSLWILIDKKIKNISILKLTARKKVCVFPDGLWHTCLPSLLLLC